MASPGRAWSQALRSTSRRTSHGTTRIRLRVPGTQATLNRLSISGAVGSRPISTACRHAPPRAASPPPTAATSRKMITACRRRASSNEATVP